MKPLGIDRILAGRWSARPEMIPRARSLEANLGTANIGHLSILTSSMYDSPGLCPSAAIAQLPKRATVCCSPRTSCEPRTSPLRGLFKALADETRSTFWDFWPRQATPSACHSRTTSGFCLSHHLASLAPTSRGGPVTAERRGTWTYYAVDKSMRARLTNFCHSVHRVRQQRRP